MKKNDGKTARGGKFTADYQPKDKTTRFSSTNQPKNRRKKTVATVLTEFRHDVSDEVVERIASVMLAALACRSTAEAEALLRKAEKDEPEFGWIFEKVVLAVQKEGLPAIITVLEWIFGKKTNLTVAGDVGVQMKPLVDLTKRKKNGSNDSAKQD